MDTAATMPLGAAEEEAETETEKVDTAAGMTPDAAETEEMFDAPAEPKVGKWCLDNIQQDVHIDPQKARDIMKLLFEHVIYLRNFASADTCDNIAGRIMQTVNDKLEREMVTKYRVSYIRGKFLISDGKYEIGSANLVEFS